MRPACTDSALNLQELAEAFFLASRGLSVKSGHHRRRNKQRDRQEARPARAAHRRHRKKAEPGKPSLRASSLSTKHVDALVGAWRQRQLSIGSIKNNLAHLRWRAERVGKAATVASKNDIYGIVRREYVTNLSKARDDDDVVKIAMKLRPSLADRGDRLWLKGSWTKGGRGREVPIRTEA